MARFQGHSPPGVMNGFGMNGPRPRPPISGHQGMWQWNPPRHPGGNRPRHPNNFSRMNHIEHRPCTPFIEPEQSWMTQGPVSNNWEWGQPINNGQHQSNFRGNYGCNNGQNRQTHGQTNEQRFQHKGQSNNHPNSGRQERNWNQGPNQKFNNKNKNKNKNKQKETKDSAETCNFYCDSCDRGFKEDQPYKEHLAGHQKCRFEGCSYVAHPKLVQLHVKLQHNNGYAKKIWQLESEADIQKWILERKRNFPTKDNLEKKKAEMDARKERGEVLETKTFGKMKSKNNNRTEICDRDGDNQDGNNRWKKRGRQRRKRQHQRREQNDEADTPTEAKIPKVNNEEECGSLSHDCTTTEKHGSVNRDPLSVLVGSDKDSDEEKLSPKVKTESDETVCGLNGGLGMILSSYNMDDEEDDSSSKTTVEAVTTCNQKAVNSSAVNNNQKVVRTQQKPVHRTDRWKKKDLFKQANRSTLLEKLLAADIRHERNIILQCVHYIVKKRFFGSGQSLTKPENKHIEGTDDSENLKMEI